MNQFLDTIEISNHLQPNELVAISLKMEIEMEKYNMHLVPKYVQYQRECACALLQKEDIVQSSYCIYRVLCKLCSVSNPKYLDCSRRFYLGIVRENDEYNLTASLFEEYIGIVQLLSFIWGAEGYSCDALDLIQCLLKMRISSSTRRCCTLVRGAIWTQQEKYLDAKNELLDVLNVNPGCFVAKLWYGFVLLKLGEFSKAQTELKACVFKQYELSVALNLMAYTYLYQNDASSAKDCFERAVNVNEGDHGSMFNFALVVENSDTVLQRDVLDRLYSRYENNGMDIEKHAISIQSSEDQFYRINKLDTQLELAGSYSRNNQCREAAKLYTNSWIVCREMFTLEHCRIFCYDLLQTGDNMKVAEIANYADAHFGKDPQMLLYRADALVSSENMDALQNLLSGMYEIAQDCANTTISMRVQFWNNISVVHVCLKSTDEAIQALRQAQLLDPKNTRIIFNLSFLLLRLNDIAGACLLWLQHRDYDMQETTSYFKSKIEKALLERKYKLDRNRQPISEHVSRNQAAVDNQYSILDSMLLKKWLQSTKKKQMESAIEYTKNFVDLS